MFIIDTRHSKHYHPARSRDRNPSVAALCSHCWFVPSGSLQLCFYISRCWDEQPNIHEKLRHTTVRSPTLYALNHSKRFWILEVLIFCIITGNLEKMEYACSHFKKAWHFYIPHPFWHTDVGRIQYSPAIQVNVFWVVCTQLRVDGGQRIRKASENSRKEKGNAMEMLFIISRNQPTQCTVSMCILWNLQESAARWMAIITEMVPQCLLKYSFAGPGEGRVSDTAKTKPAVAFQQWRWDEPWGTDSSKLPSNPSDKIFQFLTNKWNSQHLRLTHC